MFRQRSIQVLAVLLGLFFFSTGAMKLSGAQWDAYATAALLLTMIAVLTWAQRPGTMEARLIPAAAISTGLLALVAWLSRPWRAATARPAVAR